MNGTTTGTTASSSSSRATPVSQLSQWASWLKRAENYRVEASVPEWSKPSQNRVWTDMITGSAREPGRNLYRYARKLRSYRIFGHPLGIGAVFHRLDFVHPEHNFEPRSFGWSSITWWRICCFWNHLLRLAGFVWLWKIERSPNRTQIGQCLQGFLRINILVESTECFNQ